MYANQEPRRGVAGRARPDAHPHLALLHPRAGPPLRAQAGHLPAGRPAVPHLRPGGEGQEGGHRQVGPGPDALLLRLPPSAQRDDHGRRHHGGDGAALHDADGPDARDRLEGVCPEVRQEVAQGPLARGSLFPANIKQKTMILFQKKPFSTAPRTSWPP